MREKHPTIRSLIREEMQRARHTEDKYTGLSTQDYIKVFHVFKTELVEETK